MRITANKGHYHKTAAKVVFFSELFAFLQRKMCQEWHICQKGRNAAFWWLEYGHDV